MRMKSWLMNHQRLVDRMTWCLVVLIGTGCLVVALW